MTEDAQMKIRLPRVLKERIEAAATAANRSWNGEIVQRLEASFQGQVTGLPPTPLHQLEEELADLQEKFGKVMSELQAVRGQVGEIDTRTQHLLPGRKKG
ncbi:Arc family DNA-binding protein [Shinella daejeonensis]|uniref:Arc family DNA-binding protein n=1 Tax=Shinella daejeonensis TaxID=659017 RepID=UPI003465EE30|nr:Arc family DNA-binding protein [Shinella daejeonensis]